MSAELIKEYGDQALSHLQIEMGQKWNLLTDPQKSSIERSSKRLIELDLEKRAGKNVEEDLKFVKATVGEIRLMMAIAVGDLFWDAFWKGVNKALEALGSFLVGAALGIDIGGLING